MSVLIEALCLVVKRSVLDATVPGGTDGFLAHCAEQEGVRYAIADDHVTAICAFEPDVLSAIIGYLLDHDLTEYGEDEMPSGYQVIDMETGPTRDFPWLTVVSHRHGLTEAWMSDAAPGPLVVPDGWTPEDSWSLTRTDVRDDGPDRVAGYRRWTASIRGSISARAKSFLERTHGRR